jgi:hypothetical protein
MSNAYRETARTKKTDGLVFFADKMTIRRPFEVAHRLIGELDKENIPQLEKVSGQKMSP